MTETCNKNVNISNILENIPRSDKDALPIVKICTSASENNPACVNCAQTIITFLHVFDAIIIVNESNNKIRVKAKSQTATYFLRSLAQYIRNNYKLATNWEREGVGDYSSLDQILTSGAYLVYLMESNRVDEYNDLTPIRKECVSEVIIKARIRGKSKPMYLMQYDPGAQQFQLIGGRMRSADGDVFTVMKRKIREELAQNNLVYDRDYDLIELVTNLTLKSLSRTYGAYSEYDFTIYQALIKRKQLILGHNDKWVTYDEILEGKTKQGIKISSKIVIEVDNKLPGGLEGLKLSLDEIQKRPISEILKEKKWELVGIIIGIIGVILTILFFLIK
jgi:hypothetical protein